MKLCKDCKHFSPIVGYALCDHPQVKHSSIDGSPSSLCQLERASYGQCGVDGALFEQKPPEEPPKKRSLWERIGRFLAPLGNSGYLGRRP